MVRKTKCDLGPEDMPAHFDFTGGVRGKHFERYVRGPIIIRIDGQPPRVVRRGMEKGWTEEKIRRAVEMLSELNKTGPGKRRKRLLRSLAEIDPQRQARRGR